MNIMRISQNNYAILVGSVQWLHEITTDGYTSANTRVVLDCYALFGGVSDNAVDRRLLFDFDFYDVVDFYLG